ncbi:MAG: dephospho-CoA kinase [Alphaproteobacteria bacterium]
MIVLGLTGSIGMGKTTAAGHLRRCGVPVFDSDAVVHRLFAPGGGAVVPVLAAFPSARRAGGGRAAVDRAALGGVVFADPAALARLEAIVHPLVRAAQESFLGRARRRRAPLVALDIPLLFETGADARVDVVAVVHAPRVVQRARVLRRPGMTEARLAGILVRQMPSVAKYRRADWVIPTGLSRRVSWIAVRRLVRRLEGGWRPRRAARRR